ncbi:MAG: signal peptide peptidase SppA [Lentisphaerae bacterium]|nr:signal peptide peptidase SppA [Lentisphaerota bacterium]
MNDTPPEGFATDAPPPPPVPAHNAPATHSVPRPAPPVRESWSASCLRGCMMMSFAFVVVCILASLAVFAGCMQAVNMASGSIKALMAEVGQSSELSADAVVNGAQNVLMVKLSGMITEEDDSSGWVVDPASSQAALRKIHSAKDNPDIAGILLYVNSGGGGITASDVLWKSLKDFKAADTNRVVVVLMGSVAASGAYYIATAADAIVANPTTLTGSIGVILNSFNVQELAGKIGLKSVTIKSGGNKDILSPFAELTPEQQQMLQDMVDAMHSRFVSIVAEGRGLEEARVRAIADGRILLAQEALDNGLVDTIGYLDDAKAEFEKRFGVMPVFVEDAERIPLLKFFQSPTFWGACAASAVRELSGTAKEEEILFQ